MTIAHRFEQMLDRMGESVTILSKTEGSVDEFNRPTYTYATEATEDAIVTSSARINFTQVAWVYSGQMEKNDRIAYFNADSVIAKTKRVVLQSGVRYEADTVEQPVIHGEQCLKVVLLRRLTEQ